MPFEIIAVDQGSGDNSRSVLALLEREVPELVVCIGGGYGAGGRRAQGDILVLANVDAAADGLPGGLDHAVDRVARAEVDMYLAAETVLVSEKSCCMRLVAAGTRRRQQTEAQLLDKARRRGFSVRSYGPLAPSSSHVISRLLATVLPGNLSTNSLW